MADMRVVLLGPPGAGKGSQAQVLSERLGLAHIASGDLLREAVRAGTPLGQQARGYLERGELVPDAVVTAMVLEHVRPPQEDAAPRPSGQSPELRQRGFVLDGFPRTRPQAVALDQALARHGTPIDRAVYFETSQAVIVLRLAGRRVCRACGANYHVTTMPPSRANVCDRCGGPLEQREDDRPQTIARRLRVYESQTAPLLTYYEDGGVLRTVDGDLSVEALYEHLVARFRQEQLLSG